MKAIVIIVFLVVVILLYVSFNPDTRRIRKIQSLLNKDRSVCDFIDMLDDWEITPNLSSENGLRILINPVTMPVYPLYITYKGRRPTNNEIKILYDKLTSKDSIVTKAHCMNIPVDKYIASKNK